MNWHPAIVRAAKGPGSARVATPIVAATGPTAIALHRSGRPGWIAVGIIVVVLVAVLSARRRPGLILANAVLTGIVTTGLVGRGPQPGGLDGPKFGVIVAGAMLVWSVALDIVSWHPGRLGRGRAWMGSIAPVALGGLLLVLRPGLAAPVLLTGIALVLAMAATARPAPSIRVADRVLGHRVIVAARAGAPAVWSAIGRVVTAIIMVPAAVVLMGWWLVQRAVRHDPLRAPTADGTAWVRRHGGDPTPDRYYSSATIVDDRPLAAKLPGFAGRVVAIAAVLALLIVAVRRETADDVAAAPSMPTGIVASTPGAPVDCPDLPADPVLDQQPDADQTVCETSAVISHAEFEASASYRLADFDGRTINYADGVRETWHPPACSCRRITVWWFGGSAAWGYFQRDAHTLPSALARAAWEQGIALDIENRAMPGWTLGQEARVFAHLSTVEDPPDLVVFYDGMNDLMNQAVRAMRGDVTDESEIMQMEDAFDDILRNGPFENEPTQDITFTHSPLPNDTPPNSDELAPLIADHAMARYGRNVELVERLADAAGTRAAFAWQPQAANAPESAAGPGALSPATRRFVQSIVIDARPRLPARVIDLTDSLDQSSVPVFRDLTHTNEAGAALVAAALLESLRPELIDLRSN